MPFPIYQYVINLVVSLLIMRGQGPFIDISVREHHALKTKFVFVVKFTVLTPLSLLS